MVLRSLSLLKLNTIAQVREFTSASERPPTRIGFIPTMGALHEGHCSLIRAARAECDRVVVSIFVNPTQFGPGEGYRRYPRAIEADLTTCEREKVDAVFCRSVDAMY